MACRSNSAYWECGLRRIHIKVWFTYSIQVFFFLISSITMYILSLCLNLYNLIQVFIYILLLFLCSTCSLYIRVHKMIYFRHLLIYLFKFSLNIKICRLQNEKKNLLINYFFILLFHLVQFRHLYVQCRIKQGFIRVLKRIFIHNYKYVW